MDTGDLAVFAAVAQAGGITRAAQRLNTVQSNVTQRVRLLEAELGVPLFHRHSRGVSLTSAGRQLLPYAERIGRLMVEAKHAAADSAVPRGQIIVGALETATAMRLPPVLAAYAAACPDVDIEIVTGTSAALLEAVRERHVEAAFVAGPVDHAELTVLPLLEEELVMVSAPWLASLGDIIAAARLKVVVFRSGCTYRLHLEALLAARGAVAVRRLEFGTLDGIIGCVGAGIGVTLLPRAAVAQAAAEGRVALHSLPRQEARVPTLLVRRADAFVSTALSRFIETARRHLATARPAAPGPRRRRAAAARVDKFSLMTNR
jgi:LysR family transcriptional regulator, cell division regulator